MGYHYGQTIREHRMLRGMTLSQLASLWPSKELGVTTRYVSDIERGVKSIQDLHVLRELARLLQIPLWKLGLSEYNPFQEENTMAGLFDIESLEELIQDTWLIRQTVTFDTYAKKVAKLSIIFDKLVEYNPIIKGDNGYLRLSAHKQRLEEIIYTESHNYDKSLKCAYNMLKLAKQSGDSVAQAIAYSRIGVELLREDTPEKNKEAIQFLEKSCDVSLGLSKEVIAYCFAMLARGYAQIEDYQKFEKAIDRAINFAGDMAGLTVTTKDYIFHAYSAILEEKSNGYILFGKGEKAIELLPEIKKHISLEKNMYLNMWIPLDYAQGYMLQGEIEESIKYLSEFYESIKDYKSNRLNVKVEKHLSELETLGYGMLPVVKDFREMVFAR